MLPSGAVVQRVLGSASDWRTEELAEPEALPRLGSVPPLSSAAAAAWARGNNIAACHYPHGGGGAADDRRVPAMTARAGGDQRRGCQRWASAGGLPC